MRMKFSLLTARYNILHVIVALEIYVIFGVLWVTVATVSRRHFLVASPNSWVFADFYEWRRHWQWYRLSELAAQLLFFCTGSFWDIRPRKTYAIDLSNRPANRRSSCPRCHITSCQSCHFLFFISIRFRSTTPAEWPLYQRTTRIANNSLTENVYASYCARCLGRLTHRQLCSGICLSTLRSGIK